MNALQYQLANVPMLGKGLLLLDRLDANFNTTGAMPLGNVTKFGIEPKDDIAEQYGSMNAESTLINTALKKRQVKIAITGTDFKSEVQAVAMMSGGKSSLAVSAATVTGEVLCSATATKKGRYFRTANMNLDPATPVVIKGGAAFATTYVLGTDYQVADWTQGWIYFIPGGLGDAETHPVEITYNTLVATFDQVAGASVPRITAKLSFSPDPTDGQKISLDVWRVNFSPSGTSEFISDDYGNWQLEGLVLDTTYIHPTCPLYLATFIP